MAAIRGVCFCILLILIFIQIQLPISAAALLELEEISGSLRINPMNFTTSARFGVDCELTQRHRLSGNLTLESTSSQLLGLTFHDWVFDYHPSTKRQLSLKYNSPLITSSDLFRIIHKDFYSEKHLALVYQQQEPHLVVVVAEQVPSKTRLPSFVGFGQFALSNDPWTWQISAARYDSQYYPEFGRNWGEIVVLETGVEHDSFSLEAGWGYLQRHDYQEESLDFNQSQALAVNLQVNSAQISFAPSFRIIGREFDWPLTKTKPYPNDRIGFGTQTRFNAEPWRITFNWDRFKALSSERTYATTNLQLEYGEANQSISAAVHWHPNRRIVLGYRRGDLTIEWRPDLPQIKYRRQIGKHEISLAGSSLNLHRIEYRYNSNLSLHLIYKFEAKTGRQFYYGALRLNSGNGWCEIKYGQSDRGQLTAGFNHSPHLEVSWGWSW